MRKLNLLALFLEDTAVKVNCIEFSIRSDFICHQNQSSYSLSNYVTWQYRQYTIHQFSDSVPISTMFIHQPLHIQCIFFPKGIFLLEGVWAPQLQVLSLKEATWEDKDCWEIRWKRMMTPSKWVTPPQGKATSFLPSWYRVWWIMINFRQMVVVWWILQALKVRLGRLL